MQKEMIQTLEEQIKSENEQLVAKKAVLHALKKKANKKHFIETRVGRAYLTTLSCLTNPFTRLYDKANLALNNPVGFLGTELVDKFHPVLEKCQEVKDNQCKDAPKYCKKAVEAVFVLEEFEEKHPTNGIKKLIELFHNEVARLRPLQEEKTQ